MTDALHEIGERLLRFLEQALQGRDPDRDVPAAQAILSDLVDALSGPGLTRERWTAGLAAVVDVPVKALLGQPERWNEAVKLTAIYFSSEWRDEHPFADTTISRGIGSPIARPQHPVNVDLEFPLLAQLLDRSDEISRCLFFGGVGEHAVLNALQTVLPRLDLTSHEMVTLVRRVEDSVARNLPAGSFYEAVFQWSAGHAIIARAIADAWLEGDPPASFLSPNAVLPFVRGTVLAADDLDWRDKVLVRLDARHSEADWRLAVFIANLSWPHSQVSDVRRRHQFLVSRIQSRPELLVEAGIQAVSRDASEFPLQSLGTVVTLWRLLPKKTSEPTRQAAIVALIEFASRAVTAAKKKALSLEPFLEILPIAVALPPTPTTGRLNRLDFLLEDLVDVDELSVQKFLENWLAEYGASIAHGDASLGDLFPLLVHERPERASAWLLAFMISSRRELRAIASILFGRQRSTAIPREFARGMSNTAASALAHALAGGETLPGSVWVPCLVDLAQARVDLIELVKTLLVEDAAQQYSGVLRRALGQWSETPWLEAAQVILERLERTRKEWQLRGEVPELSFSPSYHLWLQREDQALGEAYRRAQGKSVFMRIVAKVPIARGEASSWTGEPEQAVPFKAFGSSIELPMLDMIDPLEAKLRRLDRRREAERLIATLAKELDA